MSEVSCSRSKGSSGPKSTAGRFPLAGLGVLASRATLTVEPASRDAIAVQLSIECAAREAEEPRRLDALAPRGLQRPQDLLALGRLERQLREPLPVRRALSVRLEEVRRQVLRQEHAALRDHHRALEDVGQL